MGIQFLGHAVCDWCGKPTTVQINMETGKDFNVSFPDGWKIEQPDELAEVEDDFSVEPAVRRVKRPIKVWCPEHADPAARSKGEVSSSE